MLEAMPAEHFNFKPVEEQQTFAEQFEHFAVQDRRNTCIQNRYRWEV